MTKMINPAPGGWFVRGWIPGDHRGTDFGWFNADVDGSRRVVAAAAGTVISESVGGGYNDGWGNQYVIDHGHGIFTTYNHLATGTMQVDVGQHVEAGTYLGQMGATGKTNGETHLHFEVRVNTADPGNRVDPGPWLDGTQQIPGDEPLTANQRRVLGDDISNRRIGAASSKAPLGEPLQPGDVGNFQGWVYGETVAGNNIWYVGVSGDYFWSGGFEGGANTAGLPDLNPKQTNVRTVVGDDVANVRSGPWKTYPVVSAFPAGTDVQVIGWQRAETLDGNNVWFLTLEGWSWSGGFTSQSVDGIPQAEAPKPAEPVKERSPIYAAAVKGFDAPLGEARDPGAVVTTLVIHHCASTSDQLDYFLTDNSRASCPTWYVRANGEVVETISPVLRPSSTKGANNYSVAIETQNTSGDPAWGISAASQEAIAQIAAWLSRVTEINGVRFAVPLDRAHIVGHREVPGNSTACPGPSMDLDAIVKRAQQIVAPTPEPEPEPEPSNPDDKPVTVGWLKQLFEAIVAAVRAFLGGQK